MSTRILSNPTSNGVGHTPRISTTALDGTLHPHATRHAPASSPTTNGQSDYNSSNGPLGHRTNLVKLSGPNHQPQPHFSTVATNVIEREQRRRSYNKDEQPFVATVQDPTRSPSSSQSASYEFDAIPLDEEKGDSEARRKPVASSHRPLVQPNSNSSVATPRTHHQSSRSSPNVILNTPRGSPTIQSNGAPSLQQIPSLPRNGSIGSLNSPGVLRTGSVPINMPSATQPRKNSLTSSEPPPRVSRQGSLTGAEQPPPRVSRQGSLTNTPAASPPSYNTTLAGRGGMNPPSSPPLNHRGGMTPRGGYDPRPQPLDFDIFNLGIDDEKVDRESNDRPIKTVPIVQQLPPQPSHSRQSSQQLAPNGSPPQTPRVNGDTTLQRNGTPPLGSISPTNNDEFNLGVYTPFQSSTQSPARSRPSTSNAVIGGAPIPVRAGSLRGGLTTTSTVNVNGTSFPTRPPTTPTTSTNLRGSPIHSQDRYSATFSNMSELNNPLSPSNRAGFPPPQLLHSSSASNGPNGNGSYSVSSASSLGSPANGGGQTHRSMGSDGSFTARGNGSQTSRGGPNGASGGGHRKIVSFADVQGQELVRHDQVSLPRSKFHNRTGVKSIVKKDVMPNTGMMTARGSISPQHQQPSPSQQAAWQRLQRHVALMNLESACVRTVQTGAPLIKYNSSGKPQKRWFYVEEYEDEWKLSWENVKADNRTGLAPGSRNGSFSSGQSSPLAPSTSSSLPFFQIGRWKFNPERAKSLIDVTGIHYGPYYSTNFSDFLDQLTAGSTKKSDDLPKPWLCFSVQFKDRTIDLLCDNEPQVTSWFLGLQALAPLSVYHLTRGMIIWQRLIMKLNFYGLNYLRETMMNAFPDHQLHRPILKSSQSIPTRTRAPSTGTTKAFGRATSTITRKDSNLLKKVESHHGAL